VVRLRRAAEFVYPPTESVVIVCVQACGRRRGIPRTSAAVCVRGCHGSRGTISGLSFTAPWNSGGNTDTTAARRESGRECVTSLGNTERPTPLAPLINGSNPLSSLDGTAQRAKPADAEFLLSPATPGRAGKVPTVLPAHSPAGRDVTVLGLLDLARLLLLLLRLGGMRHAVRVFVERTVDCSLVREQRICS
jgi:hypothetical protein